MNTTPTTNRVSALRVISLLRVSTDSQDCLRQKADQDKSKRKFALEIVRTVELQGVSGTATLDDTQVQQILKELENPDIDGIQISSLDRLFRPGKRYGQFAILDRFVDARKQIWSTREGLIDPSSDEGYDKCLTAGGRAGAEWRELLRRTRDGKIETAESGFIPHGNPKFGWDILGRRQTGVIRQGRAIINESEAVIARQIFERRRAGKATYAIARWLNDQGIRNKRGSNGNPPAPWSCTTVLQILNSTDYIGKHYWKGIMIPIPPIVSEELFYSVQALMQESKQRWSGRPSTLYRLRNFLWCERCGHRIVGNRNGGHGKLAYRCGNRTNIPPMRQVCPAPQISAIAIERTAWGAIWGILKDPKLLWEMGRKRFEAQAQPKLVANIRHDLERLEQRQRNLLKLIQDADTNERCDELRRDRNEIRTKIAALEVELRTAEKSATVPPYNAVESTLQRITEGPEPSTYDEQRTIMERIIDLRMEYADGSLTITGSIPIATDDDDTPGGGIGKKNSSPRVHGAISNVIAIPFKIQRRVE